MLRLAPNTPTWFAACCCLLTATAQAQVRVSIGPRLGLNLAGAPYADDFRAVAYRTTTRTGLEAGLLATVGRGHWAVQPALVFSQKGFVIDDDNTTSSNGQVNRVVTNNAYRFNYLTLPLNLAYAQGADGQGLQVFAGAYAGLLLGGSYRSDVSYSYRTPTSAGGGAVHRAGPVAGGDYYASSGTSDPAFYSRRFDAGLQGGLGYCRGRALLQIGYSLGLRNLGAAYRYGSGPTAQVAPGPSYRNRAFQAALTYLFASKG